MAAVICGRVDDHSDRRVAEFRTVEHPRWPMALE